MRPGERVEVARHPRAKSNGTGAGHRFSPRASLKDVVNAGRRLPKRLRRDLEQHPEAVLATVGGASFVAGAVLGSRIGRALLAAAIPMGIQHLLETELGPRLKARLEGWLREVTDSIMDDAK